MTDAAFLAWLQGPDCIRCALVEAVARIVTTETTLYLSSQNYTTGSADTPASTAYTACISGGVNFSETLNLDGQASISYGDLEIDNTDGSRDGWLDYVWANRAINVYIGDPRWPRSDFRLVFSGVIGDIDTRSRTTLNLRLLDKLQRLNNPVNETVLGGATGNKDRLIPLTFGEAFNVTPLLTNPATLEYQVHNAAIEDIIEVRDNGIPVVITKYIATGKFTLSQASVGTITASVQGDKPSAWSTNVSTLVQRLATAYGPAATRLSGGDLDSASLSAFAAANVQPVGLFVSDRANVLQVCQELASSVGAQVVMTTQGLLRLVKLALPAVGTPVAVTARDMEANSLHISDRPSVQSTAKLGFAKNYTVQSSGLAGGVAPSNAASFAQEWVEWKASDAAVAAVYKLDAEPPIETTLLLTASDAGAEATRRVTLWMTQRNVYEARYFAHLLLTELGDPITITHSRFGLSGGKTGQVVQVSRDWLGGRVTLGVLA